MKLKKKRAKKIKLAIHITLIVILGILLLFIPFSIVIESLTREKIALTNSSNTLFTIIVLPDTQYYSKSSPEIFSNQTKWIAENRQSLNIQMVIHEGDIVNNNLLKQWNIANQSLSIIEQNNIPYSVIPGNHDSDAKTNYSYYNLFFPKERFEDKNWYGGSFDNYKNSYQLLNINNKSYIFISLNFCPSKEEIEWANQILFNNSDKKAVLTTHGYLKDTEPPERYVYFCGKTEYIWNDLIKNYENLQLVLSGHMHSQKRRTDNNLAGKPVHQILADYQDERQGGSGYLRILQWDQENNAINVQTYSPYLNNYKKDYDNEFTVKL